MLVRSNWPDGLLPLDTLTPTVKLPAMSLAVKVSLTWPLASVVADSVVNVPPAPLVGSVNVTVTFGNG